MVHILVNPSSSTARVSRNLKNPTIFAEVIAILELTRSTRMDISIFKYYVTQNKHFEAVQNNV